MWMPVPRPGQSCCNHYDTCTELTQLIIVRHCCCRETKSQYSRGSRLLIQHEGVLLEGYYNMQKTSEIKTIEMKGYQICTWRQFPLLQPPPCILIGVVY